MMVMCSRCKKRPAVVFMTKLEAGKTTQEGICIRCARELGIKPVNDIIEKMGLSEEELDRMDSDLEGFMETIGNGEGIPDILSGMVPGDDSSPDGRAPVINIQKLMKKNQAHLVKTLK